MPASKRQPLPDQADDFRVYGTITVYDSEAEEQGLPASKTFSLSAPEIMIGPLGGRYLVKFTAVPDTDTTTNRRKDG